MNRLERRPLRFGTNGRRETEVTPLPVWKPLIGRRTIDLEFLAETAGSRKLVSALMEWQKGKQGAYGIAIAVRRYLMFLNKNGRSIGAESLLEYRNELESNSKLSGKTRQNYYSIAAGFAKFLAYSGILVIEDVPPGLKNVRSRPKATLLERAIAFDQIREDPAFSLWLLSANQFPTLDNLGREALAACEGWIGLIKTQAEKTVSEQINDWKFADQIASKLSPIPPESVWAANRTIESALGYLYSLYGRLIPSSNNWPPGIVDYCKYRGWLPDRVRAAFFPTVKCLDAFLVLALTHHRLMPNVDSVLYGAFIGCVSDTDDTSRVRLRLQKNRGGDADAILERRSILVKGFQALESVVRSQLDNPNFEIVDVDMTDGKPLFVHFLANERFKTVRQVDESMSAYMVKRFIRNAAETQPLLRPLVGTVTGENFRPTHILCARLKGESIFSIQKKANHKNPNTTAIYTNRVEVEATSNMRHIAYQKYLVSESKTAKTRRLGNGLLCAPQNEKQKKCFRTDLCTAGPDGCNAKRIVLESKPIIAEWMAFSAHIQQSAEYLKLHRPERWEFIWAPRLLEYETLLEATSSSAKEAAKYYVSRVLLPALD